MKLTGKTGCIFNDRIDLELSPYDLGALINLCEYNSLEVKDYCFQGIWRDRKDYLQSRYDAWQKERKENDGQ